MEVLRTLEEASLKVKLVNPIVAENLLRLCELKGESWVKRSIARLGDVYECHRNTWAVRGRRKLGDSEPLYIVKLDEETGRFKCTCQQAYKPYASSRRGSCTHIGACLFHHLLS